MLLILAMMLSCAKLDAQNREWGERSIGGVFSPKAVGFNALFLRPNKHFSSFDLTVDMSGLTEGDSVKPGIKAAFHHDIPLFERDCNGFPLCIYAGPGVVAGYVHDKVSLKYGFMAGLSCNAGVRFGMWHHVTIAVEWQLDLAFILEGESTVSIYKAGLTHSYWPFLNLSYEF